MQPLRWERRPDGLRAPSLVCAFKGWNDAGESATSALTFLAGSLGAEPFAVIDPEDFVDFQSTRPMVRLVDGITRTIEWPEFEIHAARAPRPARPGAPLRPRAGDALARLQPRGDRPRGGAGRPARRPAGGAPGRRAAL